ncbi:heme-binding protein [Phenylobacterium sp. LjRoot219]|uniref:GlcG/HbpS family heme-binding protein n=1 Tax=Phenylobacterium sp. LjRoot219 TaxID=3342283 RepID=UPI003ECE47B7
MEKRRVGHDSGLTAHVRTLNTSGAKAALAAAEKAALERGLKLSISVVDNAGNLLAFTRLDGAPLGTIDASFKKARTAALFGAPSKVFEDLLHGGTTSLLAFECVTPSQGGVPVLLEGVCVGGLGASGGSGEEDELAAKAGVDGLIAEIGVQTHGPEASHLT